MVCLMKIPHVTMKQFYIEFVSIEITLSADLSADLQSGHFLKFVIFLSIFQFTLFRIWSRTFHYSSI